jgi:hypothetical protein
VSKRTADARVGGVDVRDVGVGGAGVGGVGVGGLGVVGLLGLQSVKPVKNSEDGKQVR